METQLIPENSLKEIERAIAFCADVVSVEISSDEEYSNANNLCKDVKQTINTLEKDRLGLVKPYKEITSTIDKTYREVKDKLNNAERVLKIAMVKYYQQKELEQRLERERAEAEAEALRQKAFQEAEKARQKAEQHRDKGKEQYALKQEEKAIEKEIEAQTIVAQVATSTTIPKGPSYRKKLKVVVQDHLKAASAMAQNPLYAQFLQIDTVGLEKMLSASNGTIPAPEGITIDYQYECAVRTR